MSEPGRTLLFSGCLVAISLLLSVHFERGSTATAAEGERPASEATRIVSTNLSTDEMLLALLGESADARVIALSRFADDPIVSNVMEQAAAIEGRVWAEVETIAAFHPDLVLLYPYSRPEAQALLRRLGIPLAHVDSATSVEAIEENLRSLGRLLARPGRADRLIEDMRTQAETVARQVAGQRRPRCLLYQRGGYTAGAGTLFDELLRLGGGDNAAAELGIVGHRSVTDEELLSLDPDVILTIDYRADAQSRSLLEAESRPIAVRLTEDARFETLRAVRTQRIVTLPARYALSTSHHAIHTARAIADALGTPEPQ